MSKHYPYMVPAVLLVAGLIGCGPRSGQPRVTLADGRVAYEREQYHLAIERLSEFLQQQPERPEAARARYIRGMAQALIGQRVQAYGDLEEAYHLAGDDRTAWSAAAVIGVLHFEDHHWGAAERSFEVAIKRMPTVAPQDALLYRLGLCRERTGQWADAQRAYRAIQERFPHGVYAGQARRRTQMNADHFAVQCGAFTNRKNAESLVTQLRDAKLDAYVHTEQRGREVFQVVLVGHYASYDEAVGALARVRGYLPQAVLWP